MLSSGFIHPSTWRNRPKSLGRAHCVALRETDTVLFGSFRPPYIAKYGIGALRVTLFGQFQKGHSAKFGVASDRSGAAASTPRRHGAPSDIETKRLLTMPGYEQPEE